MNLISFIRLILRHKIILIIIPFIFGVVAIFLTSNRKLVYESDTMLFTGIGSGSSVEMEKSFNYSANNNAFDNLINLVKSRETREEVAIRLLAQHLLLDEPNKTYISAPAFNKLREIVPDEIESYIVKSKAPANLKDKSRRLIPTKPWSDEDYERTVENLLELMKNDHQNFVYGLLNYDHKYNYSLYAIGKIKAERMLSSDLLKLSFESEDPGICYQTLKIFSKVIIKKHRDLTENGSDRVVKYFEAKLRDSEVKLNKFEEELLKFNQDNSIINYDEQSKAFTNVKEEMESKYRNGLAQLAGSNASVKRLEDKLKVQELIQQKNSDVINSKNKLGNVNYKIAMLESKSDYTEESIQEIKKLKDEAQLLEKEIKVSVGELYSFRNSIEGVPIDIVMPDWINKVVEREDLKAKLNIIDTQNKELEKQFKTFAPAGANLKKIEREISVAEQEYLEILNGLNSAKIKYQDVQLKSNIKTIDEPYFPLKPIPSKRKIIIIIISLLSGFIVFTVILLMEFFDNTLRNDAVAKKKLRIPSLGMLPKISNSNKGLDMTSVQDRLMDFVMDNFNHYFNGKEKKDDKPKIITVFSTIAEEGKSILAGNIAYRLKKRGNKILFLNHSDIEKKETITHLNPWLYKFLGYQDPRVDYSHPFLASANDYLGPKEYITYSQKKSYYDIESYTDLEIDNPEVYKQELDYIIIELPNILAKSYPVELLKNTDLALLVCRSNRLWSKADDNILMNIKELIRPKLRFIINGVALDEVEALLGELPKNRSKMRKKIKNIMRFQFNMNSKI